MKVGAYELIETTGTRGVVSTYAGERVSDEFPVTVNVLPQQHVADDQLSRRLKREFAAARSIDSPYVTKYIDLVETESAVAVVTERLPGMNLRAYLALTSELSCDKAIDVTKQVAQGLYACHCAGVVHRSVTPENIYITSDDDVTIANFGLARMHTATTLTMTGTMIGDPEYAPPENLFAAPRDIRGDIYSLGVVLWEMLTGHNPFEGENLTEVIQKKQGDSLPVPSGVNHDVPHWLDILVSEMTAPDPDARPASLHQVIDALDSKSHNIRKTHDDANNCLACGYPLPPLEELWFCPYCGRTAVRDKADAEPSVLLIKSVRDIDSTAAFLRRAFREEPRKDIGKALTRMPVPVVEDITAGESRWLAESLEKRGCTTEVLPLSAHYYKVSALAMFCILQIIQVMIRITPWSGGRNMTTEVFAVFWILKLAFLAGIVGVLLYCLCVHYSPPSRIPLRFVQGAFKVRPFAQYISPARGFLSTAAVVAATFAVYFVANGFLLGMYGKIILCFLRPDPLPPQMELQLQGLASIVMSLGPLLILKIIVGRLHTAPLYRLQTARVGADAGEHRSDFAILNRLGSQISEIRSQDFRYVISSILDQYTHLSRLLASNRVPDNLRHDLSEKLSLALEAVSAIGNQVRHSAHDASDSAIDRADKHLLRLGVQVKQSIGEVSDVLKAEWRQAQDRVLRHEVAVDMLAEQLNSLRLISGGIQAAVLQAVPGGQQFDSNATRQGLEMLDDVLSTIAAQKRGPSEELQPWD